MSGLDIRPDVRVDVFGSPGVAGPGVGPGFVVSDGDFISGTTTA